MDNPRPDKVAVVDEVRSHLDEADAVIVTEYRGLKVKDLGRSPAQYRPPRRRLQDLQEHAGPFGCRAAPGRVR